MGLSSSRAAHGYYPRKRSASPRFGILGRRHQQHGSFRRRRHHTTTTTVAPVLPGYTLPASYQPLYGSYYANRPVPYYPALQPVVPPVLPLAYNNYPAPSNISSPYMMMQSPRITPSPLYLPPPPAPAPSAPAISTPYVQQAPIQPFYNNNIGGAGIYPPPYPTAAPVRLLTDWTGGGKISPGFLGPPI